MILVTGGAGYIGSHMGGHQTQRTIDDLEEYLDKNLVTAGVVINRVDIRRGDHLDMVAQIRRMSQEEEIAILGEPIPLMADLSRLSAVGMGLDEHPKKTATRSHRIAG